MKTSISAIAEWGGQGGLKGQDKLKASEMLVFLMWGASVGIHVKTDQTGHLKCIQFSMNHKVEVGELQPPEFYPLFS